MRSRTLINDVMSARDGHESEAVAMTTLDLTRPMAPLHFANPFAPVGYTTGGQPVYPAQGGRGGGGVDFSVRDDDDSPDFDDDRDDDDDDDDEDEEVPASMRGRRPARAKADDDEDDEDDPDDEGAEEDGWTPPTRESWDRVQSALKRANNEAGKRRRVGKTMDKLGIDDLATWLTQRGIDPENGQPFGDDVVSPDDQDGDGYGPDGDYEREPEQPQPVDQRKRDREIARQVLAAEQRGRRAERDVVLPILAEQAARLALADAGFTGTASQMQRALRTLDHDAIELDMDDSGFELLGIEEEIERLKEDFPTFFEPRRTSRARERETRSNNDRAATTPRRSGVRGGARAADGGDRGRQARAPKGWAEQMVERMRLQ